MTLTYGNDGNVVQMTVHGQCQDRNPNTNNPDRTCADPVGSSIAARQARLDARCLDVYKRQVLGSSHRSA